MKSTNWKDLAEIVGIAAIIGSLIFVGQEIRQEQNIARAELATDTFDHYIGIDEALREPEFATVFIKAIDRPDKLTLEEMTQMNAFLDRVVRMWQRENFLRRLGIFRESDRVVEQLAPGIFGNQYAQAWWKTSGSLFSEEFVSRLDSRIRSIPTSASRENYNKILDAI